MNPCACGWLGHPKRGCRCTPADLQHYAARVSGPVLDRLDLQIDVPALTSDEMMCTSLGEPSEVVRARVLVARVRQRERGALNATLSSAALRVARTIADLTGEERVTSMRLAEALQ